MCSLAGKSGPDVQSIILSAAYEESKCRDKVIVCYISSAVCCVPRFLQDCILSPSFWGPLLSVDAVCASLLLFTPYVIWMK